MSCVLKISLLCFALSGVFGCQDDGSNNTPTPQNGDLTKLEISEAPAAGKIAGQEWVFSKGKIKPSYDGESFLLFISDDKTEPTCEPYTWWPSTNSRSISALFPLEVGTHVFSMENGWLLNFSYLGADGVSENVAGPGVVIIDEISDNHARGRIDFRVSGANFVSGSFDALVCRDDKQSSTTDDPDEVKQPPVDNNTSTVSSLLGVWEYSVGDLATGTLSFNDTSSLSRTLHSEVFQIDVNYNADYVLDETVTPHRLTETITKVRSDKGIEEGQMKVGEIIRCIYELKDSQTLVVECSKDDSYPTSFSGLTPAYTKK